MATTIRCHNHKTIHEIISKKQRVHPVTRQIFCYAFGLGLGIGLSSYEFMFWLLHSGGMVVNHHSGLFNGWMSPYLCYM